MENFLRSFVPKAQPYDWDEDSDDNSNNAAVAAAPLLVVPKNREAAQFQPVLESHNKIGTGMAWIQYLVEKGSSDEISNGAKTVLSDLLHSSGALDISLAGDGPIDPPQPLTEKLFHENRSFELDEYDCKMVEKKRLTDEAKSGKVSLLCTILRFFEKTDSIISAQTILQSCTMSIRPADIPPEMTSRQMVFAVLSFLSLSIPALEKSKEGNTESESYEHFLVFSTFPAMPLLSMIEKCEKSDIETRNYKKNIASGNNSWSLEDESFRRKVLHLEKAFFASSLKYPNRMHMCPRSDNINKELAIICRGTLGPTKGEKKKSSVVKRKSDSVKIKTSASKKQSIAIANVCSD